MAKSKQKSALDCADCGHWKTTGWDVAACTAIKVMAHPQHGCTLHTVSKSLEGK